jgi:pyruvate dehydrogenase E2 component (dihydrolipoamide acetyltransferase)
MADLKDILVPDVGGDEVEVIEICVTVGDTIAEEDAIVTVESDKASMDIPSSHAGVVKEIKIAVGDKVSEGTLLISVEASGSSTAEPVAEPLQAETPATEQAASGSVIEVTVPDIGSDGEVDIIDVLVSVGDSVKKEDGLITLETDKATMDVPCPEDGVVKEIKVQQGGKIATGGLVLLLETGSASETTVAPKPEVATSAEAAPESSAAELKEVVVPDIGSDGEVDIIDVLVAVGDTVAKEDGLITLETDKATMDVPSPYSGVVKELKVVNGGKIATGGLVAVIETSGSSASTPVANTSSAPASAAPTPAPEKKAPPVSHAHPSQSAPTAAGGKIHATPSVRRLASEFGVDLSKVKGSGRKGRILAEDVKSYVKYELSRPKATAASSIGSGQGGLQVLPQPKVDFAKFGEIEEKPLTRIQKISGPNLHRNWVTIPHVTQYEEADITDVEAFRKEQNALLAKQKSDLKITPLVFIMKACASALMAYPQFNSSLSQDGESIIIKKYVHIGIAVDTPNGLVVPVVRDVDKKGVNELSRELMEISKKARDGKLTATDMQGGCFTISSLGGIGGTAFTPIINAPEVAILGVSKSDMKPKWNGSEFEPRLMLPLSLSYDHRVIDGALAARFAVHIGQVMSDIRKLVL